MAAVTSEIHIAKQRRRLLNQAGITLLTLFILSVFLMPLGYGLVTSLKSQSQASDSKAPIYPTATVKFNYEGQNYDVYEVPYEDGVGEWALIKKGRTDSQFIDTKNPEAGVITWTGNWRALNQVRVLSIQWDNYPRAWEQISFVRLLTNTLLYAFITMAGTLVASSFVAYGFSRFRFPFKNVLFIILISTIILPPQATLVPTYAFYVKTMGWGGTWLPLIVPHLFGNAYNIFLLRQYFMTVPRELEEAATVDGAGPLRIFFSVILPQATPALTAVAMFHFFFAWNDFFGPLIYLAGNRQANPITVGLTEFNGLYNTEPQLILAASVISMILPLTIFFLAQRVFIQGIVVTGVDK